MHSTRQMTLDLFRFLSLRLNKLLILLVCHKIIHRHKWPIRKSIQFVFKTLADNDDDDDDCIRVMQRKHYPV